jgi:hypothetical protein
MAFLSFGMYLNMCTGNTGLCRLDKPGRIYRAEHEYPSLV